MSDIPITAQEFALFQRLIYKIAGISLSDAKRVLLVGRLSRRLRHYGLDTFSQYYRMLQNGDQPEELQTMVDLLTTNETYFFREPKHFDFLRNQIVARRSSPTTFRVWSAASSSGEEAYSIAMTLADSMPGKNWEIVGSDISTQVLRRAAAGHYSLARTEGIPNDFLRRFCLRGVRANEGTLLIAPELRQRVSFHQINLTLRVDADIGEFDVIFLRNVMIYFDPETKTRVVHNLLPRLKSGGYLFIGHSETLNGITDRVQSVEPTIYQKP
ncbi:protein-glutamate O-methyltransferase CheR [uncultured Propionivibrio sp.]|uniref:CheR family methyltransferase n=1 Tax=uncultured Propionivibrio sp. TaxID=426737 RepID=UPI0029BFCBB2|nr:protein-glutamate O-methyltransferase CheR [uncultured Propionivibrio sp.]